MTRNLQNEKETDMTDPAQVDVPKTVQVKGEEGEKVVEESSAVQSSLPANNVNVRETPPVPAPAPKSRTLTGEMEGSNKQGVGTRGTTASNVIQRQQHKKMKKSNASKKYRLSFPMCVQF